MIKHALALVVATAVAAKAPPPKGGTIVGTIHFKGKAPVMPVIDKSRDPQCPKDETRAAWLVVSPKGGVQDAVVRLPNGAAPAAEAARPAFVDQKGCAYRPFVQLVMKGAKVTVRNSDPTNHNVHGVADDDVVWNEMHLKDGADKLLAFDEVPAGDALEIKCDIHPWMETWLYVTDHPYAVITGADGTFKLENVPPGQYALEVWHPHLGKKTVKVKVVAGKTVEAKFPAFVDGDVKAPE
jgi:plastocyanin